MIGSGVAFADIISLSSYPPLCQNPRVPGRVSCVPPAYPSVEWLRTPRSLWYDAWYGQTGITNYHRNKMKQKAQNMILILVI